MYRPRYHIIQSVVYFTPCTQLEDESGSDIQTVSAEWHTTDPISLFIFLPPYKVDKQLTGHLILLILIRRYNLRTRWVQLNWDIEVIVTENKFAKTMNSANNTQCYYNCTFKSRKMVSEITRLLHSRNHHWILITNMFWIVYGTMNFDKNYWLRILYSGYGGNNVTFYTFQLNRPFRLFLPISFSCNSLPF